LASALVPHQPANGIVLDSSTPVTVGSPVNVDTPVKQVSLHRMCCSVACGGFASDGLLLLCASHTHLLGWHPPPTHPANQPTRTNVSHQPSSNQNQPTQTVKLPEGAGPPPLDAGL